MLETYTISPTTGFLPGDSAALRLPQYYDGWENLSEQLPDLIRRDTIRQHIDRLEVLSSQGLPNEGAWRRAYSILSYLISAYIWTGEEAMDVVPESLAIPYLIVCQHVEMPPVITYTALILWNTKVAATDVFDLDNLDVCRSFTGTPDERWFHMVCGAMEAKAGPAIELLLSATAAAKSADSSTILKSLRVVRDTVRQLTALLQQLNERVNPNVWYHKIRPYLAGGIDERLSRGISFDGGRTFLKLAGANAGQSSLFQFFDIALGIEHGSDFAARMREYMPGPHRRLLQVMETCAIIRAFVLEHKDVVELQEAYNGGLQELEIFRSKHIQTVSRYIVVPARKAGRSGQESDGPDRRELKGVGGAPLMPFLCGMRDETRQSIL